MQLIEGNFSPATVNETTTILSKTIFSLRNELDSGRLAVGYIFDKFNERCKPALKIKSEKAMGILLRDHGLTVPPVKYSANGRRGIYCMTWDENAEHFVQTLRTSTDRTPQEETCVSAHLSGHGGHCGLLPWGIRY